jgi:hypothetical protein
LPAEGAAAVLTEPTFRSRIDAGLWFLRSVVRRDVDAHLDTLITDVDATRPGDELPENVLVLFAEGARQTTAVTHG